MCHGMPWSSYTGWERPLVIHPIPCLNPMDLKRGTPNDISPCCGDIGQFYPVGYNLYYIVGCIPITTSPFCHCDGFHTPKTCWYPWSSIKCLELGGTSNFHPSFRMWNHHLCRLNPSIIWLFHIAVENQWENSPFIIDDKNDDLPIGNGDFPVRYVISPEGRFSLNPQ